VFISKQTGFSILLVGVFLSRCPPFFSSSPFRFSRNSFRTKSKQYWVPVKEEDKEKEKISTEKL
jgi:hypothetical protein